MTATGRVVLVTGVSRDLAARFARTLAAGSPEHPPTTVVGVDVTPPRHDLGGATFVRADIRNPVIGKVIESRGVDTVVHMAMVATPSGVGGRSSMKEINVIGTMQLLAACQRAEGFRTLVVQSSAGVYGSSPRDPAQFTEDLSPRVQPRTGFGKDSVEIETFVRGLARRRPDVTVTTLRLASLMGAGVDSQITRYLGLPVVPKVMGFDARLQFLHPSDAVSALVAATRQDLPGTYNVAAPDVVVLSQALRMLGRPVVGVPQQAAAPLASALRSLRLTDLSADQLEVLTYGRGLDVTRFVRAAGWQPAYSSRAALAEFVATARPGVLAPQRLQRLVGTVADRISAGTGPARGGVDG
ncbi:UDP-glucose 4-epimerase [Friedmanniella endophytica]|uniref:UDP-glucose 4-epimerase n=1 Tax=Microlunatus kandeliicorticis TaxID=1759536 RepID=A0A7W3IPA0_9ACTN|nr:NAD-dependent epimerase/dehydratase family protein [Microlunatus kandeliicorticis]MBA8792753.1 UDP-glucose 4-epimerase [Microlunatus kandeliicorticis]